MDSKRKARSVSPQEPAGGAPKRLRGDVTNSMNQPPPGNAVPSFRRSNSTCFRISGIPLDWGRDALIFAIQGVDSGFNEGECNLSLFPACSSPTQTALLELDLDLCSEYFRSINDFCNENDTYSKVIEIEADTGVFLILDRNFLGMTPLNTPGDDIIADVIFVTGLAGHAYGSWKSRQTGCVWMKDFLPHDVKNIRIMTYGYNSSLSRGIAEQQLIDYRRGFIESLNTIRSSCQTRPIIFAGHSMGGLLILQTYMFKALLQCKSGCQSRSIFECTSGIFFFATPHQGSQVDELLEIVQNSPFGSSKVDFIKQLKEGSNFLATQREDITSLWESPADIRIASFYERRMTATVSMSPSGSLSRGGTKAKLVKQDSALLFWPLEVRIPVDSDHTGIVKFSTKVDDTYRTVVTHMNKWVQALDVARGEWYNGSQGIVKCGVLTLTALCALAKHEILTTLESLYPYNTAKRHIDIKESRKEGIGKWALEGAEFSQWIKGGGTSPLLWVRGIPGSGKTYFSSAVIDHLLDKATRPQNTGVAYVYFDYNEQDHQTPSNVLLSIMKQLSQQLPEVPPHVETLCAEIKQEQRRPIYSKLLSTLIEMAKSFSRSFVIFDAFDECKRKEQREVLLPLCHRLGESGCNVLMTSRPFPDDIQHSFRDVPVINFSAQEHDLTAYIYERIRMNPRAEHIIIGSEKESQIISDLVNAADGMFLFISLNIDYICQQPTRSDFLAELAELKRYGSVQKTLDATYDRIMRTLQAQHHRCAKLAMKTLSWLVHARRVLTIEELRAAVSVKLGAATLDNDRKPNVTTVLDVCAGLVVIDERSKTVRLTHATTKEYILRKGILSEEIGTVIARACITYLLSDSFRVEGASKSHDEYCERVRSHPLLEYSARSLSYHMNHCDESTTMMDFLKLAKTSNCVCTYFQAVESTSSFFDTVPRKRSYHPLNIAAAVGHAMAVQSLLPDADLTAQDRNGHTALHLACQNGHERVIRLLLESGKNAAIRIPNNYGETPMHLAVTGAYEVIVQLLIENDDEAVDKNVYHYTPLHLAAAAGHTAIVRLLLDSDAAFSIDCQGDRGYTALHFAAERGHKQIAQLLVDCGKDLEIDLDIHDGLGHTPLCVAAANGHQEIIRIILASGTDIAIKEEGYGDTALHVASSYGQEETVQILLDNGASVCIGVQGENGFTPLHVAAERGNEEVAQLLLKNGASEHIEVEDIYGDTPLHLASMVGTRQLCD